MYFIKADNPFCGISAFFLTKLYKYDRIYINFLMENIIMIIKESAENYLESILIIKLKKGNVRSIDIANQMGFSKASVSVAMKALRENGYILVNENGNITLTDKGHDIADKIYERHLVIAKALMALGVDEEIAYKDSCKIEHDISTESFNAIKEHMNKKFSE